MSLDEPKSDAELRRLAEERTAGMPLARRGIFRPVLGPDSPLRDKPASRTHENVGRSKRRATTGENGAGKKQREHDIQAGAFDWIREHLNEYPQFGLAFAVPNGGFRTITAAAKLKAEGVQPGVPDIVYPVPKFESRYGSLYIEVKLPGGDTRPSQADFQHALIKAGNCVKLATTTEMIIAYLREYDALE